MPLINLTIKHGQSWDAAKASFEKGITDAQAQFAAWIQRVDWAPDRTSATLFGKGFELKMRVDTQEVHAVGEVPFFAKLLEAPLKTLMTQTFQKQLPKK